MKQILLLFLISALFAACKSRKTELAANDQSNPAATVSAEPVEVSGTITTSHSYCGGAAPPKELLEEMRKPKPFAGKVMYIRSGDHNTMNAEWKDSVVAGPDGKFSIRLKPGTYCFLHKAQMNRDVLKTYGPGNKLSLEMDKGCMEEWLESCLRIVEVKDQPVTGIDFHLHQPCFIPEGIPCLRYTGPYPP